MWEITKPIGRVKRTEIRASMRPHVFWNPIPANWSIWGGFAWNKGEADKTDAHPEEEPLRHTQPMRGLFGVRWDDVQNPKSGLYVELITEKLSDRAVVLTDNIHSHAEELADFVYWVRRNPQFASVGVPIGSGMELSVKHAG